MSKSPSPALRVRSADRRTKNYLPYFFIAPAALLLAVLYVYPFINGILLSFTDTDLVRPRGGEWVGLENFQDILSDPGFWKVLGITLLYTAGSVIGAVGLGLLAAVLLDGSFRGRGLARTLIVFPWAVPTVAGVLSIAWIFDNQYGLMSWVMETVFGIDQIAWLNDPTRAFWIVIGSTVWMVFPLAALVLLAALQGVSHEQKEAAEVDGADRFGVFLWVVLPSIRPMLAVITLLVTIWSFRRFEVIWLLTGGGPLGSTTTLVIDVYKEAFSNGHLGRAAALGIVGLILSSIATTFYYIAQSRSDRITGVRS